MEDLVDAKRQSPKSIRNWSALDDVCDDVSVASWQLRHDYVERRGDVFRWSIVRKGGAYPLLRTVARYVEVDYNRLKHGFCTLPNGTAILCENSGELDEPDAWAIINLDQETSRLDVQKLIVVQLSGEENR
jgi:hypothetical protein